MRVRVQTTRPSNGVAEPSALSAPNDTATPVVVRLSKLEPGTSWSEPTVLKYRAGRADRRTGAASAAVRDTMELNTETPFRVPHLADRRKNPDRRQVWRGGRRDSDWLNRPPDARFPRPDAAPIGMRWQALMSILHLW